MNAPEQRFVDGLDPATLEALAGGKQSASDWPEPQPIPARGDLAEATPIALTLLPPALQSAVREVARFNKIPEASPALVGIGTLATAIGKHERQGAFAVMSGEGRPVFDAILGKYSGESRTGDAVYLAGISGDSISRDRVGSGDSGPEDRVIRRPCLNVCVMVQPDKYLEVAAHPALRASGALARIWPAWLPSMVGRQHERLGEPGLSADRLAPYSALIRDVLAHVPDQDGYGRTIPHQARLSAEATEARVDLHNLLQDRMADGGDLADVRDIAAKAVSQSCKLALVLHIAADPSVLGQPVSEIDAGIWAAAHCIGLWFLEEAVQVQRAAVEDPTLETARRTLDWLSRRDEQTISARTLSLYGPRPRPDAKMASAVLELLEDLGWLRAERATSRRKPL